MSNESKGGRSNSGLRGGLEVDPTVTARLAQLLAMTSPKITFLAGDGSDRSYYRIVDESGLEKAVLMFLSPQDATLLAEDRYDWTHIRMAFSRAHLPVPQILARLPEFRLLVIEDCGDETLEMAVRNAPTATGRLDPYKIPISHLVSLLGASKQPGDVWATRAFDFEKLQFELLFFHEHFVEGLLKKSLFTTHDLACLLEDYAALASWLAAKSKYLTHRDYHSRNILVDKGRWSIIDFQDARIGPASYDLVSLALDPYVGLTSTERLSLISMGSSVVSSLGSEVEKDVLETWKPCGLQRIIKALGSFAYLTRVKKRGDYLSYAPRAIDMLCDLNLKNKAWPYLSGPFLEVLKANAHQLTSHD